MYLNHPVGLDNLPHHIEPNRLDELTTSIRENRLTREEESELVTGHLRLLLSLAQKWSYRSPHLSDVFVADGMFAILQAIRKAPEKLRPDKSITQYIIVHITTSFKKAVVTQQLLKPPGAERSKDLERVKNGRTYIEKKGPALKRHGLPKESRLDDSTTEKRAVKLAQAKLTVKLDRYDLREAFELATRDPWEKAVLELKKYGYTQVEIAERMKTTRVKIAQTLHGIEDRLRVLLAEE